MSEENEKLRSELIEIYERFYQTGQVFLHLLCNIRNPKPLAVILK